MQPNRAARGTMPQLHSELAHEDGKGHPLKLALRGEVERRRFLLE